MNRVFLVATFLFCLLNISEASGKQRGIAIPNGFMIREVADATQVHDIYSMVAQDDQSVLVAGRGYIDRLEFSANGLKLKRLQRVSKVPKNGAQGLLPTKDGLICTGDQGVLKLNRSTDGNLNGPPEVLINMKTGAEHGTHAVRFGPDGKLYVLAGNATAIESQFFSSPTSPVTNPRAGFLMRVDLSSNHYEIVADGFRNAYDFDFNEAGEIFVYDSDGERDISLPWYRPTRVFQIRPGDDAGWVNAGWKRPSHYFDMPRTIAKLGRGSPTGVVVHRPAAFRLVPFPQAFDNAVFVGDWTFGRVIALLPQPDGEYLQVNIATSTGQFGFAVTDLAFDASGNLLVSVGGRGTQGGVFQIQSKNPLRQNVKVDPKDELAFRIRAERPNLKTLIDHLSDQSPTVRLAALEQLLAHPELDGSVRQAEQLLPALVPFLNSPDSSIVGLAFRVIQRARWENVANVVARMDEITRESELLIQLATAKNDVQRQGVLSGSIEMLPTTNRFDIVVRMAQLALGGCAEKPTDLMFAGYEPSLLLKLDESSRVNAIKHLTQAFRLKLSSPECQTKGFGITESTNGRQLEELGRLIAMMQLSDTESIQPILIDILNNHLEEDTRTNSVQSLIHWLTVLSKVHRPVDGPESKLQNETIATCIAHVPLRLRQRNQPIDRNFEPRFRQTLTQLFKSLPVNLVLDSIEGAADELFVVDAIVSLRSSDLATKESVVKLLQAFAERDPSGVTPRHISILAKIKSPSAESLIRKFGDRSDLRSSIVQALIRTKPQPSDVALFTSSLQSERPESIRYAVVGLRRCLERLPADQLTSIEFDLARVASRVAAILKTLGAGKLEQLAKDESVRLLRVMHGKEFGYRPGVTKPDSKRKQEQQAAIDRWQALVKERYPDAYATAIAPKPEPAQVKEIVESLTSLTGSVQRGALVYKEFKCLQCHESANRLGPRLEGISKRFSQRDLIRSIVDPSENVPDRFRTTLISTVDGNVIKGTIIYDSVAAIVLQKDDGMTATISAEQIDEREFSKFSLMPNGLMDSATKQDWADLISYLESR